MIDAILNLPWWELVLLGICGVFIVLIVIVFWCGGGSDTSKDQAFADIIFNPLTSPERRAKALIRYNEWMHGLHFANETYRPRSYAGWKVNHKG